MHSMFNLTFHILIKNRFSLYHTYPNYPTLPVHQLSNIYMYIIERPHRTSKTMKTELPSEILFSHILPRLPAKYVSRFKCVSKQWNSFLKTPYFSKIHLHHVTNDHHKFLFFSSSINPKVFHNLDCETPDQDGLPVSRSLPFEVGSGVMLFITSFNGLVCVGINEGNNSYEYSNMIIWNPCTGDYI